MIREIIKDFLNLDNTKNYIINKYLSFFSLIWLKIVIKKDHVTKSDLINYFLSKQYRSLKTYQIKYFYVFFKIYHKIINRKLEKIIIKIIYQQYLKLKQINQLNYHQFKSELNTYFFDHVSLINEINDLYLLFIIKNKKMNKYLTKIKEITEILKSEDHDYRRKNNLIDEIDHINKKHQKLFTSKRYDNIIMYYQKMLLKLDSFIFNKSNIFMLSEVNYGYLNPFLTTIKYNFKTKGNIYKSQIFETCMFLNNFCRFMDRYGFKISYAPNQTITNENVKYILD